MIEVFVPLYRLLKIGVDVRSFQRIENGMDYLIEKGEILSAALMDRCRCREAFIVLRKMSSHSFLHEVSVMQKFEGFEGIAPVCMK